VQTHARPESFADTSGWGCYFDERHPQYENALLHYRLGVCEKRLIVTTNYVVAELVALLTSPLHLDRPSVIAKVEDIRSSPNVEIVHISPALDNQAWELLKSRPDKEWSLVDCASFVVMQQRGITEALTTDHHFEQAGFARLLR